MLNYTHMRIKRIRRAGIDVGEGGAADHNIYIDT